MKQMAPAMRKSGKPPATRKPLAIGETELLKLCIVEAHAVPLDLSGDVISTSNTSVEGCRQAMATIEHKRSAIQSGTLYTLSITRRGMTLAMPQESKTDVLPNLLCNFANRKPWLAAKVSAALTITPAMPLAVILNLGTKYRSKPNSTIECAKVQKAQIIVCRTTFDAESDVAESPHLESTSFMSTPVPFNEIAMQSAQITMEQLAVKMCLLPTV